MKKLNLGCGKQILSDFINVDIQKSKGIDKSFNFNKFPYPFKNDEFGYILVDNVLEHLDDPQKVLFELRRITKNNGIIHIIVPYWNAKAAYNDITHKHFFNERTFELMCDINHRYKHKIEKNFEIVKLKLRPIKLFKIVPSLIRNRLSNYLCNVIEAIDIKIKVIK